MADSTTIVRDTSVPPVQQLRFGARLRKQLPFQVFIWLGIAFLLVFSYAPMFGVLMAFKDYRITTGIPGIFTSTWVGLMHFRELVSDYNFPLLVRNTLAISLLKLFWLFRNSCGREGIVFQALGHEV